MCVQLVILFLQKLYLWLILCLSLGLVLAGSLSSFPTSELGSANRGTPWAPLELWPPRRRSSPSSWRISATGPQNICKTSLSTVLPYCLLLQTARQSSFSEKSTFFRKLVLDQLIPAQSPKGSSRNSLWTRVKMTPSENLVPNIWYTEIRARAC